MKKSRWTNPRFLAIPLFGLVYAYAAMTWTVNSMVALVYGVASVIAYIAYAIDKSAARKGHRRTSEKTLHLLALGCGWPGALLGHQLLRHKTSKMSFLVVFWGTVLLNVAAFVAVHALDLVAF